MSKDKDKVLVDEIRRAPSHITLLGKTIKAIHMFLFAPSTDIPGGPLCNEPTLNPPLTLFLHLPMLCSMPITLISEWRVL